MRKLILPVFLLLAASAAAVQVDRILVRQQWPWHDGVQVEYALSGLTDPVDLNVRVYCDGTLREIPAAAIVGDVYGVSDSVGSFTIDPTVAFGSDKVRIRELKVVLDPVAAPASRTEVLYKIFDLSSGACEDVTRADILNGKMGAYETSYGANIGTGVDTHSRPTPFVSPDLDDILIWTGVTNDVAYRTTKLVMRKISAKDKAWLSGDPPGTAHYGQYHPLRTQYWVKLTYDYYIAVFETTLAQWKLIYGSDPKDAMTEEGDANRESAANMVTVYNIVGFPADTTEKGIVTAERAFFPTNSYLREVGGSASAAGRMWKKTGVEFTLPTIAEWEYACMGGTTNAIYSGLPQMMTANVTQLAWIANNSPTTVRRVGQKPCNAYGLYDMLGNVVESVLGIGELNEGGESGTGLTAADPVVNPLGTLATSRMTTSCGACWSTACTGYGMADNARHASRHNGFIEGYSMRTYLGFRFVIPARADGQWADHPAK